jgi:hypothetical protein
LNAAEGDGENINFSNLHTPKFSKSDNDSFLWISRIPQFMLKQVPVENALIQAYMADPANAYKSKPSTIFTSAVVKSTSIGSKKGTSSSSVSKVVSPTKKQQEDPLHVHVPKRKRGQHKQTPTIPTPIVEDSEETDDDASLEHKKKRNKPPTSPKSNKPPTPPLPTPPKEFVLANLEGIFPDFVEPTIPSVDEVHPDDLTFVVKKDFNDLLKKVEGLQTEILSSRTSAAESFKAASISSKATFDEVMAVRTLQVSNQQIMAQHTTQLAATQNSLNNLTSAIENLTSEVSALKDVASAPPSIDSASLQTALSSVVAQVSSVVAPIIPALVPLQRICSFLPGNVQQVSPTAQGGEVIVNEIGSGGGQSAERPRERPLIINEGGSAGGSAGAGLSRRDSREYTDKMKGIAETPEQTDDIPIQGQQVFVDVDKILPSANKEQIKLKKALIE